MTASLLQWTNNASSTMASGIASGDTAVTVQSGEGSFYPDVGSGQYAVLALEDVDGNIEYVWLTGVTGDTLTIVRAQEGTSALDFASGSRVEVRTTAGQLAVFLQKTGGDTLSGTTDLTGTLALGSSGSITGGEFTGKVRSGAGVTSGQISVSAGQPMSGSATILTSSNVAANLPSGTSLAFTGMVVFWAGASNAVPSGWQICDGTNGTPDLQDTFVFSLSVGSSYPSSNSNPTFATSSVTLALGSTDSYTLLVADIPAHGHDFWCHAPADYSGSGTFTGYENDAGSSPSYQTQVNGHNIINNTGGGGGHTHGLTAASAATAHTHTATPPYVGLFAIMKL